MALCIVSPRAQEPKTLTEGTAPKLFPKKPCAHCHSPAHSLARGCVHGDAGQQWAWGPIGK